MKESLEVAKVKMKERSNEGRMERRRSFWRIQNCKGKDNSEKVGQVENADKKQRDKSKRELKDGMKEERKGTQGGRKDGWMERRQKE